MTCKHWHLRLFPRWRGRRRGAQSSGVMVLAQGRTTVKIEPACTRRQPRPALRRKPLRRGPVAASCRPCPVCWRRPGLPILPAAHSPAWRRMRGGWRPVPLGFPDRSGQSAEMRDRAAESPVKFDSALDAACVVRNGAKSLRMRPENPKFPAFMLAASRGRGKKSDASACRTLILGLS